MPRLPAGPSPARFAKEWTKDFAKAVRDAAGQDGRLTRKEVEKLAARSDGMEIFADNAANWLKASGQQSVSVDKLIARAHNYAEAVAARAAGADGRMSLVDARALPNDLIADFERLRGLDPNAPDEAPALTADERARLVKKLAPNVTLGWFGEDDGTSCKSVRRKKPVAELTGPAFLKAFGFDADAQMRTDQFTMHRMTDADWDGLIDTQWDQAGQDSIKALREMMKGLEVAVFTVEDRRPFGAPCFLIARSEEGELFGVRGDIGGMGF